MRWLIAILGVLGMIVGFGLAFSSVPMQVAWGSELLLIGSVFVGSATVADEVARLRAQQEKQ